MRLLSIILSGEYKGLKNQTFNFSYAEEKILALIGLNGSGKSQLLELIGESFSYLERWQRDDFKTKTSLGFGVTIHYLWDFQHDSNTQLYPDMRISHDGMAELKLKIEHNGNVIRHVRIANEWVLLQDKYKAPFPFIIGYSSGLNENLQRSFMKNANQHFEIRRIISLRQKEISGDLDEKQLEERNKKYANKYPHIFHPMTDEAFSQGGYIDLIEVNSPASQFIYLDYDNIGLLILSLSILKNEEVDILFKEINYKHPAKVVLQYDFRSGIIESETIRDVKMLIEIAGEETFRPKGIRTSDKQYDIYEMDYLAGEITLDLRNEIVLSRLRDHNYSDALILFLRLNKIQQLGVKNWSYNTRQNLLKDNFLSTVKKPLQTKLPLSISQLFMANSDGDLISFDDLSDGEAQFILVIASTRIFSQVQSLFLFDEPETHLNPSWRTYFHSHITRAFAPKNESQGESQFYLSTHSPFMISSLKRENVFFFERDSNHWITMEPVSNQTYGASFDILIKNHYGLRSLISQTVVEEVRKHLPTDNNPESMTKAYQWIEDNLGESMEKAYLLRKLRN